MVSCQAINEVGMGEMERKTITALTGEACPSAASATMIIIIIVILLIIFGLIAVFILYRKNLLCFAGMILLMMTLTNFMSMITLDRLDNDHMAVSAKQFLIYTAE